MKLLMLAAVIAGMSGAAGAAEFADLQRLRASGITAPEVPAPASGPAAAGWDLDAMRFNHNERVSCLRSGDPFEIPAYLFATPPAAGKPETITIFGGTTTGFPADEGKCVNTDKFRSAVRLSDKQRAAYRMPGSPDTLVYANVRHLDRFYVAAIPVSAISELYYQVVYYPVPLVGVRGGHVQVRVLFSRPVRLTPQFPADPDVALEVSSLIFSGQAVGTSAGINLDPFRSIDGSMLLGLGVYTDQAKLIDQYIEMKGRETRQYRLRLSAEQKQRYARAYLADTDFRRLSTYFILTSNNCSTNQLRIIDSILSYTPAQAAELARTNSYDPDSALAALAARGLASEADRVTDFEKEEASAAFLRHYSR
ncbi:MAG: DUF4105 domain-containing protein [Elusimicrobiota bacterium]